jgi:GntR family transcriptional regulator, sialic acid-inducible nan operon repressor
MSQRFSDFDRAVSRGRPDYRSLPWRVKLAVSAAFTHFFSMKQKKLYQQVEEALSEEIAEGVYKPGDALPAERDLMERFGVGRPSIREALFSLSRRGLIEIGSGRRPRVAEPSFDIVIGELDVLARQALRDQNNLFYLMELRRILECALARKLAVEINDKQISELQQKLEENEAALGDLHKFWRTDSEFHKTIARMCGNPLLPVLVGAILSWLIDNRKVTLSMPGSAERACNDHHAIFNAIRAHQPEAADLAMAKHLISVEERVRSALMIAS